MKNKSTLYNTSPTDNTSTMENTSTMKNTSIMENTSAPPFPPFPPSLRIKNKLKLSIMVKSSTSSEASSPPNDTTPSTELSTPNVAPNQEGTPAPSENMSPNQSIMVKTSTPNGASTPTNDTTPSTELTTPNAAPNEEETSAPVETPSPNQEQVFTIFNKLPAEIRLKIWEKNIPARRIHELRETRVTWYLDNGLYTDGSLITSQQCQPTNLEACSESREEFQKLIENGQFEKFHTATQIGHMDTNLLVDYATDIFYIKNVIDCDLRSLLKAIQPSLLKARTIALSISARMRLSLQDPLPGSVNPGSWPRWAELIYEWKLGGAKLEEIILVLDRCAPGICHYRGDWFNHINDLVPYFNTPEYYTKQQYIRVLEDIETKKERELMNRLGLEFRPTHSSYRAEESQYGFRLADHWIRLEEKRKEETLLKGENYSYRDRYGYSQPSHEQYRQGTFVPMDLPKLRFSVAVRKDMNFDAFDGIPATPPGAEPIYALYPRLPWYGRSSQRRRITYW